MSFEGGDDEPREIKLDENLWNKAVEEMQKGADQKRAAGVPHQQILKSMIRMATGNLESDAPDDKAQIDNELTILNVFERFGITAETGRAIIRDIKGKLGGSKSIH